MAESLDREAITLAAAAVDRELADDAPVKATAIAEGLWRFDQPPLRCYLEIRDADRLVRVTNLRRL